MDDITESLAATRSRRSNAGSRLKQLLAMEETPQTAHAISEDDQHVNLLFQEEADDASFDEEDDNSDEEEDDEDNGENPDENGPQTEELGEDEETSVAVNSDDVLSDSDLSVSDSDESEGEKELQTQEKAKKRKIKKALRVVPAIKRPRLDEPRKPKVARVTSESLTLASRRASSRAAVVENKQALVRRLKESEKRRALITPVVRVKEREMTQEERLAESVLTEEANIISLNEFREQEVVKKERQRLLLLLKRVKLRNVIRSVSLATLISPLEEIEQSRHAQAIINAKLKRKPGRRRKVDINEPVMRLPGEIDTELPMVKADMERERLKKEEEERRMEEKRGLASVDAGPELVISGNDQVQNSETPAQIKEEPVSNENRHLESPEDAAKDVSTADNGVSEPPRADIVEVEGVKNDSENAPNEPTEKIKNKDLSNAAEPTETTRDEHDNSPTDPAVADASEKEVVSGASVPSEGTKTEKKVSFAVEDTSLVENPQEEEIKPVARSNSGEIFEGPAQLVARNLLYFIDFEEDKHLLSDHSMKTYLFGPEANTPASHRFRDVRTIMRIGQVTNPYAVVKEERDPLFEAVSELTEEDTMFDELKKLPRLGVAHIYEVEDDDNDDDDSMAIHLKTEAPTGLYLPNGNKKKCSISGKEVRYFDPSNGMPYGSVDTFKILKAVETGGYQWLSFEGDFNSYGGADLYLTARELARHAKGVPEGFAE